MNRTVNVGSTARNSSPLSKVWLLVSRFSQNSQKFSVFFLWTTVKVKVKVKVKVEVEVEVEVKVKFTLEQDYEGPEGK